MACFSAWDIQACGCVASFSQLIRGCNSLSLIGYSIEVYDGPGGTHLATMTTDGTGHVLLATGNYWIESTDGRFAGPSFTVAGASTRTLTPATGYHCAAGSGCVLPLADTLIYTDSLATFNLLNNGTNWCGCNTSNAAAGTVIARAFPVCTAVLGTATVVYQACFTGSTISVHWCIYVSTPAHWYNGDGAGNSPICSSSSFLTTCGGGPCYTAGTISQDLANVAAAITCGLPFSASGTNLSTGTAHSTANPAPGAWTLSE